MSAVTHTQGRWYAEKNDGNHWSVNCAPPNGSEGSDAWLADLLFDVTGETEANARLMASAPDLPAAAVEALETYDHLASGGDVGRSFASSRAQILRTAIAKATTGETK